jgi:acyl-CoA hydrolase
MSSSQLDDQLRAILRPGQDIVVGQALGFPIEAFAALVRHKRLLEGSRIFFGMTPVDVPPLEGVSYETFFPFGPFGTDEAMAARKAAYCRRSLYDISRSFRDGERPVDIAVASATPARGRRHSLGLSADYIKPAIERAAHVVLEIVGDLPWAGKSSTIAHQDTHVILEATRTAPVSGGVEGGDIEIAKRLLDWIPDGATLEFGMGKWSAPLFDLLGQKRRDLKLHTGSFGDWLPQLLKSGALNRDAPLRATAIAGSRAFYDAIPDLGVELAPAYLTHEPSALRALARFRAINSVLEVDLLGRANCEYGAKGRRGGLGGLPDYASGAAANPDGLSILALSASAGAASRIVARLPEAHVSLNETMVDIVVTEFGAADLRGRQGLERVRAMLAIAAPQHRVTLEAEARSLGFL